jgi:uncharacterized membrane protein
VADAAPSAACEVGAMYSKTTVFGHPIHPVLVMFPIAFYTATLVSYIVYSATNLPFCFQLGVVANIAGVATAALAALPGFVDWNWGLPGGHPAKAIGLVHMGLHVAALGVFGANAVIQTLQWNDVAPTPGLAIVLSAIGFVLTGVGGYLGAELVQRHHVGIDLTPEQNRIDMARSAHPSRAHSAIHGL